MDSVAAVLDRIRAYRAEAAERDAIRVRMARYVGPVDRPWRCCSYCAGSFDTEGARAAHRAVCRGFRAYLDDALARERARGLMGK